MCGKVAGSEEKLWDLGLVFVRLLDRSRSCRFWLPTEADLCIKTVCFASWLKSVVLSVSCVYMEVDTVLVIFRCRIADSHKCRGSEYRPPIISQNLQVECVDMAYLGPLVRVLQGCTKVLAGVALSSGAWALLPRSSFKVLASRVPCDCWTEALSFQGRSLPVGISRHDCFIKACRKMSLLFGICFQELT